MLGLLSGLTQPVWAQTPTEPAANDPCMLDARCKELADRGLAEYQGQRYEASLGSLRQAYGLQPVPWLLFNIGRAHQNMGRTDEALAAYRAFLQQSQAIDEAWQREKARVYVARIERDNTIKVSTPVGEVIPPPPEKKPIYKKWWIWAIVGGGTAAAVIVGTAIGVSVQKPDLSNVPSFRLFPSIQ